MSISIRLFEIGMKNLGARRSSHVTGPHRLVSFNIENMRFIHSGFGYVICEGKKITIENRQQLQKELGKEYPESYDFEYNRIYSFKGLIVLILIILENYTKQNVSNIINESYMEALKCKALSEKKDVRIEGMHSVNMLKLYGLLAEYDKLVNPFADCIGELKEPARYLEALNLDIDYNVSQENAVMKISSRNIEASVIYETNNEEISYIFRFEERRKTAGTRRIITFSHIFKKQTDVKSFEEIIIFNEYLIKLNGNLAGKCIDSLKFSLATGLAWKNDESEKAKIVTEKQIEAAIKNVDSAIELIRSEIISKMLV